MRWFEETALLRKILLECELEEEIKWNKPCFTHQGRNICIIQNMNDFLALLFFKGVLLNDPEELLEVQGPNSRSDYRMRFTSPQEVLAMTRWIKSFVEQSIKNEKAGRKVELPTHLDYPWELLERFESDPELKGAFDRLTPGRKRGYILYFSQAKQSTTRARRIAKCRSRIIVGKGMLDR
ncbi:MAG: YdeI/OmpD-associated family protein [Paracoccaceae bacterium]|nr:YdeI/OmpD-associated family protein [Paracoccaceae bacterium]MDE2761038.1 YdeI/OmpD-associated family protein [Paracoccaceae bacterium]MDE2916499.1 YdeI/OmpD-associated family protein [Paracoccaceae bacterium]